MPRLKSRRRTHDPSDASEEDAQILPLGDENLREEELVNLLGIETPTVRHESSIEEFSWEVYLENSRR